jgi:hypothetical protein
MGQCQGAEVACDGAQVVGPVGRGGVDRQLVQHDFGDTVQQRGLVRNMSVEQHRIAPDGLAEATHRKSVDAIAVNDRERCSQHRCTGERSVVPFGCAVGRRCGGFGFVAVRWRIDHRGCSSSGQSS